MKFTKWQGTGNDFVLVAADPATSDNGEGLAAMARRACDRHFGIGADGLIFIWNNGRMLQMKILNADGSEAEMCGNGLRCAASLAYARGLTDDTSFPVQTGAGVLRPELLLEDGQVSAVRVDMGEPVLTPSEIPVSGVAGSRVVNQPIEVAGNQYLFTAVSMGNPHCLIFVDDVRTAPVGTLGSLLERHPNFPKRSNVEFVAVRGEERIDLRVWERGVGETLACGTGACATVVGSSLAGRCGRKVWLSLPGGRLLVEWRENNRVYLTGPAVEVFQGVWNEGGKHKGS